MIQRKFNKSTFIVLSSILFPFFLWISFQQFDLGIINEQNLFISADAILARDIKELSTLRFFNVFPQLPIYLLLIVSQVYVIPTLALLYGLASLFLSCLIAFMCSSLEYTNRLFLGLFFVFLSISPINYLILTESFGVIWSILCSIFITYSLLNFNEGHMFPVAYAGGIIAFIFLSDVHYFPVIMIYSCFIFFLFDQKKYSYDVISILLLVFFPLCVMVVINLVGAYLQNHQRLSFLYGFPNGIDYLNFHRVFESRFWIQLGEALFMFPTVLCNCVLIGLKEKKIAITLFLFPILILVLSVEGVRQELYYWSYAYGIGLITTLYLFRKYQSGKIILLFCLTQTNLFLFGDDIQTNTLKTHAHLKSIYAEDFKLAEFLKEKQVMLDYKSARFVVAYMTNGENLIVPYTDLFTLSQATKKLDVQYLLIPQFNEDDRVLKIYKGIDKQQKELYHKIYESKRWFLLEKK